MDARDIRKHYDGSNLKILVPGLATGKLILLEEGTGDNLLDEDMREGYVDYLNWSSYTMSLFADGLDVPEAEFSPVDGGMIMLRKYAVSMEVGELVKAALYEAAGWDSTVNADCFAILIK